MKKALKCALDIQQIEYKNSLDFIEWCNGNFEMIYAFEPDVCAYNKCLENINLKVPFMKDKITMLNAATWNEDTYLTFSNDSTASSRITSESDTRVAARSIDSVLDGKPASYIKLDDLILNFNKSDKLVL